jgi:cupin fold WbuC family metalloprotein
MIQVIDAPLIQSLITKAQQSPRLRTNHNFHQSFEENPHRFLNVMLRGSYFTPHRHLKPPKHESFLVLQGEVGFLQFDDTGKVLNTWRLGPGGLVGEAGMVAAVDIAPGIWHALVVISEVAVCYEVKPGPYIPTDDKEFAPWAPVEGSAGTTVYTEQLLKYFS